jgi:DNA-binding response OmpR family regulator
MSYTKQKIMVVDDDENICELLRLYLEKEGYEVYIVNDGLKAIDMIKQVTPELVVLDIMLPGADGWQVCREIRKFTNVPVIFLSAKGETFDKVLGLELGADDYVEKPFETKELLARIKAVLRRVRTKSTENLEEVVYPNLVVNKTTFTVLVDGKEVQMPPKELELLYFLSSNPNKVYTRDQLLEYIWGYDFFGDSRTVDVHIKRLRGSSVSAACFY